MFRRTKTDLHASLKCNLHATSTNLLYPSCVGCDKSDACCVTAPQHQHDLNIFMCHSRPHVYCIVCDSSWSREEPALFGRDKKRCNGIFELCGVLAEKLLVQMEVLRVARCPPALRVSLQTPMITSAITRIWVVDFVGWKQYSDSNKISVHHHNNTFRWVVDVSPGLDSSGRFISLLHQCFPTVVKAWSFICL